MTTGLFSRWCFFEVPAMTAHAVLVSSGRQRRQELPTPSPHLSLTASLCLYGLLLKGEHIIPKDGFREKAARAMPSPLLRPTRLAPALCGVLLRSEKSLGVLPSAKDLLQQGEVARPAPSMKPGASQLPVSQEHGAHPLHHDHPAQAHRMNFGLRKVAPSRKRYAAVACRASAEGKHTRTCTNHSHKHTCPLPRRSPCPRHPRPRLPEPRHAVREARCHTDEHTRGGICRNRIVGSLDRRRPEQHRHRGSGGVTRGYRGRGTGAADASPRLHQAKVAPITRSVFKRELNTCQRQSRICSCSSV
jgi:hypothetical protein